MHWAYTPRMNLKMILYWVNSTLNFCCSYFHTFCAHGSFSSAAVTILGGCREACHQMVSQQGATGSHTALCDHVHCPVCGTMQEAPCVTHLRTTMSHMRASHTCSSTLEWKCSLAVVCIKWSTVAACAPALSHTVQRCLCKVSVTHSGAFANAHLVQMSVQAVSQ